MNQAGRSTASVGTWAAVSLWTLSGLCFVVTTFVPWAETGLLSRSSPVDVAGLARSGVLVSVPDWLPWLVVIMPLAGAALVGLSVLPRLWPVLVALLLVAALGWAAILREVVGASPAGWGWGAWLGAAGVVLGVAAGVVESNRRRRS